MDSLFALARPFLSQSLAGFLSASSSASESEKTDVRGGLAAPRFVAIDLVDDGLSSSLLSGSVLTPAGRRPGRLGGLGMAAPSVVDLFLGAFVAFFFVPFLSSPCGSCFVKTVSLKSGSESMSSLTSSDSSTIFFGGERVGESARTAHGDQTVRPKPAPGFWVICRISGTHTLGLAG